MSEAASRRGLLLTALAAGLVLAALVALRLTAVERGVAAAQRALDAHDLVTAEAEWREVLAADPSRADALYGLGWTLHLAGQPQLAHDAFARCAEEHPESPLGFKGLGSVAMAEGNAALARRRFQEALEKAPEDIAIRHSLGLLDLTTGRADDAAATFEALTVDAPERTELHQALAEARIAQGRPEDALAEADRALALAGEEPRARALASLTRARALLAASAGRVDPQDCAATALPVYAWLEEADRAIDIAEATGVEIADLAALRRAVRQRRGITDDACPGERASSDLGKDFPGG